ncbi:MAG: hypothetical protein HY519_02125, partial [Candidatus Aenigmarchaeota archaeon]|nr:hypothetical protein [Candidatus Aenigmarchaeota archaeon]
AVSKACDASKACTAGGGTLTPAKACAEGKLTHVFQKAGKASLALTVKDDKGAVAQKTIIFTIAGKPARFCKDSDNGANQNIVGTVTAGSGDSISDNPDSCASAKTLSEYVCVGSTAVKRAITCPFGCANGACKPTPTLAKRIGGGSGFG